MLILLISQVSWNASFTGAGSATLSVKAQLIMNANYESDEFVEARVRVDGQLFPISRLTGDGTGGRTQRTRYLQFDQELNLGPGEHTVTLECFNDKKTYRDERSICLFDDLTIQ